MININKNIKRYGKLFSFAIFCIVILVVLSIFCVSNAQVSEVALSATTATPTYSTSSQKIHVLGKKNPDTSGTPATNVTTVTYNSMNGGAGKSPSITASQNSSGMITITSDKNCYYEALYVDLVATINVPAWHKYEIKYTLNWNFHKTATSSQYAGYEIYDFNSDTIKGSNAGFTFGTPECVSPGDTGEYNVSTTTPATYTKKSAHFEENTSTHSGSYTTLTLTFDNRSNSDKEFVRNFGMFAYVRATTNRQAGINFTVTPSHTLVSDTKYTVTKPGADSRTFKYTGESFVYTPVYPPASESGLYRMKTPASTLTQSEIGTYDIIFE